ncbi:MAG: type I restriction endonuclease subunit R [Cyanobacteriota bacterium]
MTFNEDSRVKLPAVLHLNRLGYEYLSLKDPLAQRAPGANIFIKIFSEAILRLNPQLSESDIDRLLGEISLDLENEDLGKTFSERLLGTGDVRLIDWENFSGNNRFHVVTELPYVNGEESFRPDITLLINGLPLAFIEVKKPNNSGGTLQELTRIDSRCQNPAFRPFINLTQLMIFSNNMEYDPEALQPIQGAFYAAPAYQKVIFNYFREEEALDLDALLLPEDDALETFILRDNNLQVIKHSPEFVTNKDPETPTHRLLTSLCQRERLGFTLKYGLAYVRQPGQWEKHILRYPQFFALRAIRDRLSAGVKQGIIWHTQGSGKTALTFYCVRFLTDYFQTKGVIPRFYFIVDRLDLLEQAAKEFSARGLVVHRIESKQAFAEDIQTASGAQNLRGQLEITVVNIQKFINDPDVIPPQGYDVQLQRLYFLDEVHRSYDPRGSFLANLVQSDPGAIKIGLTGTPLLGDDYSSKLIFGDYIHTYYYDASIRDGYTLRLIREEIQTTYKQDLQSIYDQLQIQRGQLEKRELFAHPRYVAPLLEYIVTDFERSRRLWEDATVGGMVVCDSAEQAKEMNRLFQSFYAQREPEDQYSVNTAALILHDVGVKQERKGWIEDFKQGKYDLLFVYNMLLTGFDAPRLKKLYLGRVLRRHSLLQALTRVNRTYRQFRYGYVVDFADIQAEFKATNDAYFKELQADLGDEFQNYSQLFKSPAEISAEIGELKDLLFQYNTGNLEVFHRQVSQIEDKATVQSLNRALENGKRLYNLLRLGGESAQLSQLDALKLGQLQGLVAAHLRQINLKEQTEDESDLRGLLDLALEEVIFMFVKVKEEELVLADRLKERLRRTREALANNIDPEDPEFISLKEELERLFRQKKLSETDQTALNANIATLDAIYERVKELNRKNKLLRDKYGDDAKFTRIHKRVQEQGGAYRTDRELWEVLQAVKAEIDEAVLQNVSMDNSPGYWKQEIRRALIAQFRSAGIALDRDSTQFINNLVFQEYLQELTERQSGA